MTASWLIDTEGLNVGRLQLNVATTKSGYNYRTHPSRTPLLIRGPGDTF